MLAERQGYRRLLWRVLSLALPAMCLASANAGERVFRRTVDEISTLDPARAADVFSSMAVALVYEGLVEFDYTARPYRLKPLLAEALPEISPDGLRYTFRIRSDAYFSDSPCFQSTGGKGRRVTAHDVVYSLKRLADVKTASTGYWLFRDSIEGLDAFRDLSANANRDSLYETAVSGLFAPDETTVVITLTRPLPRMLWALAMPYAFVVPHEAVAWHGDAFANQPVGSGPYVLSAWRRRHKIEFERNPSWDRAGRFLADGRRPVPDRIQWFMIADPTTRWLCFLDGQTDLYERISRDVWDLIISKEGQLLPDLANRGIVLSSKPGLQIAYCGFNMDDPLVGRNKALRQAMSHAFNAAAWERFHNGRVLRAAGPIPPGLAGHSSSAPRYGFDLEKARAFMREAGFPEGIDPTTGRRLRLTLELGRTDQQTRESSELLAGFMAEIGIVLELSYNSWPAFLEKLSNRQAQMFRVSWVGDYPDAENFLALFYGPNVSPGSNRANYSNPEFDRLFEQAIRLPDSPERTALYERLAAIVAEDAPWIFLGFPVDYTLHHAHRLLNYAPHDFPYGMEKHFLIGERGN